MIRAVFQFFSMLALGVLTLGFMTVTLPWVNGQTAAYGVAPAPALHLASAVLGLVLGLCFGVLARYHWADIPRRMVTWVLVRERQFFYYALIVGCVAVLLFY